ncbi:hypothetical protein [Microcystis phage Mwe-JY05]
MNALAPPVGTITGWVWPTRETPRPWQPSWARMGPGVNPTTTGRCVGMVWPTDPYALPYPCRHTAGHRHRCEPGPR